MGLRACRLNAATSCLVKFLIANKICLSVDSGEKEGGKKGKQLHHNKAAKGVRWGCGVCCDGVL